MEKGSDQDDAVELPIDGTLDLHTFHPKEIKSLIPDYIEECKNRSIFEIRIIHGKGTGTLREIVHSILKKNPDVVEYGLASGDLGSWGATLVKLKH